MGVITAIETQKKHGKRRSIFVDGQFVAGVHEEVAAALGLNVGQTFDRDQLAELIRAETVRKARERALKLIGYRDRSESEIRKRLIGSNFPEDVVEEVVDQLSRSGLLDDLKFSRDWVKSRTASKPMGRTRLAFELRSKGVDAPIVEEVLEALNPEAEYELALSAAEARLRKLNRDDPSTSNKLSSFLQRRGFSWDVIERVLNALFE
ncbi:MAG: recombination regulator RecX [Armatimonadetes bacterium]|nr:recombination regulator RecX [Armatimonadota bacterium]